jgi:hypothetical protein
VCKHSVLWLARLFGVVVNRTGYRLTRNKIEGLCVHIGLCRNPDISGQPHSGDESGIDSDSSGSDSDGDGWSDSDSDADL